MITKIWQHRHYQRVSNGIEGEWDNMATLSLNYYSPSIIFIGDANIAVANIGVANIGRRRLPKSYKATNSGSNRIKLTVNITIKMPDDDNDNIIIITTTVT